MNIIYYLVKFLLNYFIKVKQPFVKKEDDWVCLMCKNINFNFRKACNRCKAEKPSNIEVSSHVQQLKTFNQPQVCWSFYEKTT